MVDALVSLLCAMLVCSLTFSVLYTANPTDATYQDIVKILQQPGEADSGVTFTWIPVLFNQRGAGGRAMCVTYFIAISAAAFSSFINLFEFTVRFLRDCNVPRVVAVSVIGLAVFIVSLPSAVNTSVFINQSTVWRAATFLSCFVLLAMVCKFGVTDFAQKGINEFSAGDWHLPRVWQWMIKFVVPVELAALFVWYVVTEVRRAHDHKKPWYAFTTDSFTTTLAEWSGVIVLCLLLNILLFYNCGRKIDGLKDKHQYEKIKE